MPTETAGLHELMQALYESFCTQPSIVQGVEVQPKAPTHIAVFIHPDRAEYLYQIAAYRPPHGQFTVCAVGVDPTKTLARLPDDVFLVDVSSRRIRRAAFRRNSVNLKLLVDCPSRVFGRHAPGEEDMVLGSPSAVAN